MNGATLGTFVSLDPGCMMRMDGFEHFTRQRVMKHQRSSSMGTEGVDSTNHHVCFLSLSITSVPGVQYVREDVA